MMKNILILSLFFVCQVASGQATSSGSTPSKLNAIISPEALTLQGTPGQILAATTRTSGLPGGIAVLDERCSHGARATVLIPSGSSVGQALDLVGSVISSTWQINDGVVNMYPANGIPALLDVQISSFDWNKTASVEETVNRLVTLPSVSQKAKELGLTMAPLEGHASAICIRGNCSSQPKPTPVIVAENNASLLSILNRIVAAHDGMVWGYFESHCQNKTTYAVSIVAQ